MLRDLVVLLGASTLVILASQRLRIPPIVGLLLTGIVIGPSGFGLITEPEEVQSLAEIGVVALLFTIGLEFSLERLRHIRRAFLLGGSQQAIWSTLLALGTAMALGYGFRRSLFFGFLLTLSSTAIVLKLYGERRWLDSPHGRIVIGILLFQDFLVAPMIIVAPALGEAGESSPVAMVIRFGGGVAVMVAVFFVARRLMPRVLHALARARIREIFLFGALFAGLGMALLTEALQFSLALGAFIAGLIISESEYSHQVIADVSPFRDVFNSIFFVSIGMLLDLGFVAEKPALVFGAAALIMLAKFAIIAATVKLMAFPLRTALLSGASLAQIGEFSFVLATVGVRQQLLDPTLFQLFIASSVLTMMATPAMIALARRATPRLERSSPSARSNRPETRPKESSRVTSSWSATAWAGSTCLTSSET